MLAFVGTQATAQKACTVSYIADNILKGNATAICECVDARIEIITPDTEGVYSKAQAEVVLRNLFKSLPADQFEIKQEGASKGNSRFFIGTYKSKSNTLNVYGLLKSIDNQMQIIQLHFEE